MSRLKHPCSGMNRNSSSIRGRGGPFSESLPASKRIPAVMLKTEHKKTGHNISAGSCSERFGSLKHTCAVCEEEAAGFHFGAFTCEGCKSFFGRATEEARVIISECKTGGNCNIKGRSRTSCKSCRLKKCQTVGMSRQRSRYGRRSTYFKVQCLLDAQQVHQKRTASFHQSLESKRIRLNPRVSDTGEMLESELKRKSCTSIYPSVLPSLSPFPVFSPSSVIKSTGSARVHRPVPIIPNLHNIVAPVQKHSPDRLQWPFGQVFWPYAVGMQSPTSSNFGESPNSVDDDVSVTAEQTEPLDLSTSKTTLEPLDLSVK